MRTHPSDDLGKHRQRNPKKQQTSAPATLLNTIVAHLEQDHFIPSGTSFRRKHKNNSFVHDASNSPFVYRELTGRVTIVTVNCLQVGEGRMCGCTCVVQPLCLLLCPAFSFSRLAVACLRCSAHSARQKKKVNNWGWSDVATAEGDKCDVARLVEAR